MPRLNQPAAMPTTDTSDATPRTANRYVAAAVIRCRSAPCWAAAQETADIAASAVAADQTMMPTADPPVSAVIAPPIRAPTTSAATSAATSRGPSSRARRTGVSSSQKPSAAEASTGPNNRETASARATARASAAQGSTVRADRHDSELHSETTRWARMTTLTMAPPIISAAITAM